MQVKLTIGERLKDLRVERKLTLEQLAAEVGISKSALGKYESDNGKDISPYSILLLADYYGVSCDYLMGRTETKNHPNTALHELHLSDASIDVLRTGKFNHRLLSELICHKDFQRFMLDAEIYVDRIADMRVNDMNAVLEAVRQMALMKNGGEENDLHLRTLEVAQIARTLARCLQLNEDLTEAIALGHDLGHTPFGHIGEHALDRLMPEGFRHNEQSKRCVEALENDGNGLNLTWEVRNGIVTHTKGTWAATPEGRIVRLADQIAFVNHDIEDAVRAGVLDAATLPKDCTAVLGQTKSARITTMINSILTHSEEDVRMGTEEYEAFLALRDFMYATVYVDKNAKREEQKVDKLIAELYEYYLTHVDQMSNFYVQLAYQEGRERAVTDYISGMSDEFAIRTFEELFVPQKWHVL